MVLLVLAALAAIGGVVVILSMPEAWLGALAMTIGFGLVATFAAVRLVRDRDRNR